MKLQLNTSLERSLKKRHLSLIALGSTIGVGLFLGSASAIKTAGPSVLLAYLISGLAVYFVMRALAEMAIHQPVAGSFTYYAHKYLGPLAGYVTGWNYYLYWLVMCIAEITAVAVYMQFWFPDSPHWMWALLSVAVMTIANLLVVKTYGEIEFWFALIKIVAISCLIIGGLSIILFGIGNQGMATGFSNLWIHDGFFAKGAIGLIFSFPIVLYSYAGLETLGLTAGEAEDPKTAIAKASRSVVWRILIFYIGALLVILSIYPWNGMNEQSSPFVTTFEQLGIKTAAGIINFVVITAALSSCNGGIFSTARTLYSLAHQGQAPRTFINTSSNGIPQKAVLISASIMLIGVFLNYLVPEQLFIWMTSLAAFGAIWTWLTILVAQLKFRAQLKINKQALDTFLMPLWPYTSYLTIGFFIFILCVMSRFENTRIALYVGPIWILFLTVTYFISKRFLVKPDLSDLMLSQTDKHKI